MIDPLTIIKEHFASINLSDEEKEDIEATFKQLAQLLGKQVQGEDVDDELEQVKAQVKLWRSGAWAAINSAFWAAAEDYAVRVGKVLLSTVKGLI